MSRAYYNEIDRNMAAWLRELIHRNLIAPGEVDERSIEDVRPSDLRGFTQCHFFAGIGVWSYALRLAGWSDDRPVWTGSCPCQPFSQAGKGVGFADERHLWPAWFHLIQQCRPAVVFGEQVASPDGLAWLDLVQADMEGQGYAIGASDLCAAGVGAPHIRQRLFFVANADRRGCEARSERYASMEYRAPAGADSSARGMGDADDARLRGVSWFAAGCSDKHGWCRRREPRNRLVARFPWILAGFWRRSVDLVNLSAPIPSVVPGARSYRIEDRHLNL